jgi:FOG: WD40-like repeat
MKNRVKVNLILILDLILILLCVKLLAPIFAPDVHFASSAFSGLATVGKDAEFDAVIINRGILPALKVDVCLMDNDKIVIKKTIYFLKKGEKADIVFKYKFLEQGTHRVKMLLGCKERKDLGYSFETKVEVLPSPSANSTLFKKNLGGWYSTQFSGSSPVIYNGKLYVGGKNEYFFCLNKDTGEKIWSYKVTDAGLFPGIYTTPVFYKGNVYFGSTGSSLIENGGHICALNAENGSLVWKYDTASDVYEISLDDGKIYAYDGKFTYAINAVTGKLIKKIRRNSYCA